MKQEEIGSFSDVLFYLERRGIDPDHARDIVMQVFNWGVSAALDRLRPTRPKPPDAPAVEAQFQLGEEPKPKTKREPKKAPHRIPEDFTLTPELRKYASDRNFTPTEIESMWAKFYSHSKANGKEFVDWKHAWLTWVMRGVEYKNRDNQQRKPDHIDGRL